MAARIPRRPVRCGRRPVLPRGSGGPGQSLYFARSSPHNVSHKQMAWQLAQRRAEALTALHATTLAINQQGDLTELLHAIVQRAADLVHAHMGGLYMMRPDRQSLELVVTYNLPGDLTGTILRLGEGLSGQVALTGEVIAVDDYTAWGGRAAAYEGLPFRRVLGVPLKVHGTVIGVINVTDDTLVGPFDPDEVRLVQLFAEQAAIAIQNSWLLADARRRSASLVGLYELAVAITGVQDRATLLQRLYEQVVPLF
ncbi:MAG: GAF domain-containing protein, partial [Anaerolineae bacterium]|nr:GAF domain-containing protein [Anaerolineae bacterium]